MCGLLPERRRHESADANYDPSVTLYRSRAPFAFVAASGVVAVTVLTWLARRAADPFWGTSLWVLGAMAAGVAAMVVAHLMMDPGWLGWRRALVAVTMLAIAYPGLWAAAVLFAENSATGRATWGVAVLAGTAHIPVLASFSLLPLLAARYLGSSRRRARAGARCHSQPGPRGAGPPRASSARAPARRRRSW